MTDKDNDILAPFFADAQRSSDVPDSLMARVLADADREQAWRQTPQGGFAQLRQILGGWVGVSGLATACAAGVWLGFAPPAALPDAAGFVIGGQTVTASLENNFGEEALALWLTGEEG